MSDTSIPGSPDMSKTLPCVTEHTAATPACAVEGHGASGHSNNCMPAPPGVYSASNSAGAATPDQSIWSRPVDVAALRRLWMLHASTERKMLDKERMGANASLPPTDPAATPPPRRSPRKSGLYAVLHSAQQHGFTPPSEGFWVMLPKEFDAILALEHKAVAQVVLEVLRQTIGTVVYGQDGRPTHKEWAVISQRHFARAGLMTNKAAWRGIEGALEKGYILRRQVGARRFEYSIRWRGTN
jgi:hypothetical protein